MCCSHSVQAHLQGQHHGQGRGGGPPGGGWGEQAGWEGPGVPRRRGPAAPPHVPTSRRSSGSPVSSRQVLGKCHRSCECRQMLSHNMRTP